MITVIFTPGCGRRHSGISTNDFEKQVASWFIEEAARLLPKGARVVIWSADPPPNVKTAARLGEAFAGAARAAGFDVRLEQGEWPEAPTLDEKAIEDLRRRHDPLKAIFAVSTTVLLDDRTPPRDDAPLVFAFGTRPNPQIERWVRGGRIVFALMPAADKSGVIRSVQEAYRIIRK